MVSCPDWVIPDLAVPKVVIPNWVIPNWATFVETIFWHRKGLPGRAGLVHAELEETEVRAEVDELAESRDQVVESRELSSGSRDPRDSSRDPDLTISTAAVSSDMIVESLGVLVRILPRHSFFFSGEHESE